MTVKPGQNNARYEVITQEDKDTGDIIIPLPMPLLKSLGWEPKIKLSERIKEMVQWTLENDRWLRK